MKRISRPCLVLTVLLFLLSGRSQLIAQDQKIAPRIDISYEVTTNEAPMARVNLRKRIERRFYPMPSVRVDLYFNDISEDHHIGEVITDQRGQAFSTFPKTILERWDTLHEFTLYAEMTETDSTEEASESITLRKARLIISTDNESGNLVAAKAEESTGDGWQPIEGLELKFFVSRQFGKLPISDDYAMTDVDGIAQIDYAMDLPGDKDGIIKIAGIVEDSEDFGSLFAYTNVAWGKPLVVDSSGFAGRTLWSSRDKTPIWLLVFPNLIILGVWGTILYLLILISRIKNSES